MACHLRLLSEWWEPKLPKTLKAALSREIVKEEEEQLMEERKKRKEDKKKREAAQKKATEQKNKVPELPKPGASPSPPATSIPGTCTAASGSSNNSNNNAKRPAGSHPPPAQQQPSPRYPPREVPPRFRHQEQKQLLKRGQQLPGLAVNLGAAFKPPNSLSGESPVVSEQPATAGEEQSSSPKRSGMPPIRDLVSHSPNQSGLNHSTRGPHYEDAQWGDIPASGDSSTNWDKVLVDGSDKEAWPSVTSSEVEPASECLDADCASSAESERNPPGLMASRGPVVDVGSMPNGIGHGSPAKFGGGGGNSNNVSGGVSRAWGVALSAVMSTGQVPADASKGVPESSNDLVNSWGALNSSSEGGLNPCTLNPGGSRGAWPTLESNGAPLKGPGGGSGPVGNNPRGSSALGLWGGLPESSCEARTNGTRKASRSGQPQNLNPEVNGPNNHTTNLMTSSLPNAGGSVQGSEPAGGDPGPRAWGLGSRTTLPLLQASPGISSPPAPHLSNGEAKTSGSAWAGPYSPTCSVGDRCAEPSSRASSNTVNAAPVQPVLSGASGTDFETHGDSSAGGWEGGGAAGAPNLLRWGDRVGTGWGGPTQSTDLVDGEWNKPSSNQNPPENGTGSGKTFMSAWQSAEEEEKTGAEGPASPAASLTSAEQHSRWAKAGRRGSSGDLDSPEERAAAEGACPERRRGADQYALLQSIVNRTGLDPRVLSNSGWGQTPIKQNTSWDTEASPRGERKVDNGTGAWGDCSSGGGADRPGLKGPSGSGWGEPQPTTRWGDSKPSSNPGGWEPPATSALAKGNQPWAGGKDDKPSASPWSDAEKFKPGWGDRQQASPRGWTGGPAVDGWGDSVRSNHWGEMKKSSSGSSDSDKSASGWHEPGKAAAHWGGGRAHSSPSAGWEEAAKPSQSQAWGAAAPKPNRSQSWEAAKPLGSPDWNKQPDGGGWGVQPAPSNALTLGWLGGPMPAPAKEEEPTGWEEPSPESIRRKLEIDDGTSAWGDPSRYDYKNVNMWNKNLPRGGDASEHQAHGPPQQQQQQQLLPTHAAPGAGPEDSSCSQSTGWGEPLPAPTTVDNGTSAWGKPVDTGTSWGESVGDAGSAGSWGGGPISQQASSKAVPKSMQVSDGWCGGDMPLTGGPPASWEEVEDVEIGMWNSSSPQDVNPSLNWLPYAKRLPSKGTMKTGNKQEETWINPFVKQFANLSFSRESPEEIMHSNKMDVSGGILPDKRMEMEKHSLIGGEYSRAVGKGPGPRPQVSKESSMDRSPYLDKDGLPVADDPPSGLFLSSQNSKPPPAGSSLPNQALSGSLAGLATPNLTSGRQNGNPSVFGNPAAQSRSLLPPAQPLNASQPNPRAQVPPSLLSPQVPVSLLKYAPNNGGLNPLFAPQQVAMLNQLSQLSQLQRLLAQQRKVQTQRNAATGARQQEQQGRPLPLPCQLDPSLLLKQPQLQTPALKSFLESELQKGPPPPPPQSSSFGNFPLGLNNNLNVNVDTGSIKEPQSRLRKWTTVDSISANSSLDQNVSKHGAISSGFRLEETPFVPYDFMNSSNSPASPPGSIGDGWPCAKSPTGSSSVNWPPEFRPGEPWKGYPNIDPETDPYITPGSVTNNLSINTVREADHLRDRSTGSSSSLNTALPSTSAWSSVRASNYHVSLSSTAQSTSARTSDSKSTWAPASVTNTSLAHELWKVPLPPKSISAPSRPPPGLTGQKLPLSTWDNSLRLGGGWSTSEARYTPGSHWTESGSAGRLASCCLILKNLTPQIDGSTLRTLCMQHGPLTTFHLNLPHGNALVRYSSKEEVVKAQRSLHMCVLGNTTILAEFASEEEISRFFAQGQSLTPSPTWQSLGGASQSRLGSAEAPHAAFPNRHDLSSHWNGAELPGASLWGSPSYSGSLWGTLGGGGDGRGLGSPSPLHAFLSLDHLGAGGGPSNPLASFSA